MLLHLGQLLHLGLQRIVTPRCSSSPPCYELLLMLFTLLGLYDVAFLAMLCYYWTYRDSGMLLPVRLSCFKYASLGNTYLNFDLCEAHLLLREACPIWSLTYLFQKRFKKYSCWDKTMVVYYYDLNCNFNILNYFTNWYTRK